MHVSHHSKRHESLARELSNLAVRALYFEVKSHPKPGLVSFISKGAHDDMHGGLFYRSLCALRHYFYALVLQDEAGASFAELKQLAIRAEQTMLVATEGVNTHRGALFALGLVIVSVSRLFRNTQELTPIDVHNAIKMDWHEHLNRHQPDFTSHGSHVRQRFVIVGAKEVAMQGYPMVFEHLTPFLQLFHQTGSLDDSCLYAYAAFLSNLDDSNIVYRHAWSGLEFARDGAKRLLALDCLEARRIEAHQLHHQFSEKGISPGGVGDLLAVLLFVGQLFSESLRWHS